MKVVTVLSCGWYLLNHDLKTDLGWISFLQLVGDMVLVKFFTHYFPEKQRTHTHTHIYFKRD